MSNVDLKNIQKLLQGKEYSKIILEIESQTVEKNRSAALHNLLGFCRASQKGKTDRDVQYALNDFEAAFYKDNLGQISLDSLCSHITLCAEMGRKDNNLVNNFLISEKMYLEAKKKFSKNERYLSFGIDLYKYLLKHKKKISILEEIINSKELNKIYGSSYITSNMYLPIWKQKNFAEFQKKFSNLFHVLDSKKPTKIDLTKKKINVGFFKD